MVTSAGVLVRTASRAGVIGRHPRHEQHRAGLCEARHHRSDGHANHFGDFPVGHAVKLAQREGFTERQRDNEPSESNETDRPDDNALRPNVNFLNRINPILPVQSPPQKYSSSQPTQITSHITAVSSHLRGGSRSWS
jgi:hypothetical protein